MEFSALADLSVLVLQKKKKTVTFQFSLPLLYSSTLIFQMSLKYSAL